MNDQKKERPILFSTPMVKAILEGRKTMTRRIIKPASNQKWLTAETINKVKRFARSVENWWTMAVGEESRIIHCGHEMDGGHIGSIKCPYGKVGDLLWVRETFLDGDDYPCSPHHEDESISRWVYRADIEDENKGKVLIWKPSIHMPRAASRITLEITNLRVERLQDISEEDAASEGVCMRWSESGDDDWSDSIDCLEPIETYRNGFKYLWNFINGADSWNQNPFVWVIEFKKVEADLSKIPGAYKA